MAGSVSQAGAEKSIKGSGKHPEQKCRRVIQDSIVEDSGGKSAGKLALIKRVPRRGAKVVRSFCGGQLRGRRQEPFKGEVSKVVHLVMRGNREAREGRMRHTRFQVETVCSVPGQFILVPRSAKLYTRGAQPFTQQDGSTLKKGGGSAEHVNPALFGELAELGGVELATGSGHKDWERWI